MFGRIGNMIKSGRDRLDRRYNFKDERNTSRRNLILACHSSAVAMNLAGGNFLTGLLLLLNADNAYMGLMTMGATLANTLQILSPLLLEKFPSRKKMLIFVRIIIYFLYIIMIGITPYFGFENGTKLTIILITIFMYNVVSAFTSQGYSVWHIRSIPENIRARYFSFMSITGTLIVYPVILLTSRFIDSYKAQGNELEAMTILRIAALFFCILDVFFLFRIKEYPPEEQEKPLKLLEVFSNPIKDKKYLMTPLIAFLYTFPASIPGPYYSVYLLKDVEISYTFLNALGLLAFPAMLISYPLWTRRINTSSWFKALSLSMALWIIPNIINSFVTRNNTYLLIVTAVIGVMVNPGIGLVFSNLQFINLPRRNQTSFLGFFATINNLSAFLGAFAGKEFIGATEGIDIRIFGFTLQNKQYVLLLASALMIISVMIINMLIRKKGIDKTEAQQSQL